MILSVAIFDAPGFLRIGPLRLPVYALFATSGVITALLISQPAARRVGLSAQKVWDAGVFAVIAALAASRLLLVVFNFRAFLRFPLLVLSLPSLTYTGMLLAAIAVGIYLHLHQLPWRSVADGWAPGACVLAAILAVAHFVEGTGAGMPTRMPWGVVAAGDSALGRTHPVQVYAAAGWLALAAFAWMRLRRGPRRGSTAAVTLLLGGLLVFLTGMVVQPLETYGVALLEEGQWLALAAFVAGGAWWIAEGLPLEKGAR